MTDTRAAVAEALEARVRLADAHSDPTRYMVAYSAHAAFTLAEHPCEAAHALIVTSKLSAEVAAWAELSAIHEAVMAATRGH